MKEDERETPTVPTWQQSMDRLVDGELADAESRELLALLDGVEGGWRRLALAYVETQCLSREFSSLVHSRPDDATSEPLPARPVVPVGRGTRAPHYRRRVLMTAAMAASMLVAFVAGLRLHSEPAAPQGAAVAPVAGAVGRQTDRAVATVPHSSIPSTVISSTVPAGLVPQQPNRIVPAASRHNASPEPRLVVIGSDETDGQGAAHVVDALRRMGHRVDQRHGVMPVRLQDGRRVDVPFDQLDVQSPGAASYQ